MRTFRITLDIELRPLTADEIANSGCDGLDEDCQPTGTDDDLDEVSEGDMGQLAAFAIESSEEMWAGSSLFAAVERVTVV